MVFDVNKNTNPWVCIYWIRWFEGLGEELVIVLSIYTKTLYLAENKFKNRKNLWNEKLKGWPFVFNRVLVYWCTISYILNLHPGYMFCISKANQCFILKLVIEMHPHPPLFPHPLWLIFFFLTMEEFFFFSPVDY